jgi:hypothetical protein
MESEKIFRDWRALLSNIKKINNFLKANLLILK